MNDVRFLNSVAAPNNSTNSIAAAENLARHIGPLHSRVLAYLRSVRAGATDEELMDGTGIAPNTLRPRRRELQIMGRVKDSGATRPTKSGRKAVVWVAT
jgi:hypothetical protein